MSNSHFIWRRIAVTKDREELTSAAWEYLQKVASALMTTDFSGNKAVLGDKLLNALGYEDWPDLRKSSKLEHELSFILECERIAQERYKGKLDRLFMQGDKIRLRETLYDGDSLKKKYHQVKKSLHLSKKDDIHLDEISLERILNPAHHDIEEADVDKYKRLEGQGRVRKALNSSKPQKKKSK